MPHFTSNTVEAQQFDGTATSAELIKQWVTKELVDFTNPANYHPVPGVPNAVAEVVFASSTGRGFLRAQDWLVLEPEGFVRYSPEDFAARYPVATRRKK